MVRLRIAALQFNPRIGHVAANIDKANRLLDQNLRGRPCDVLVLPEFAFTGYNFASSKELEPYLEVAGEGVSANWASGVSRRLGCHTLVGFPERDPSAAKVYNSASFFDNHGKLLFTHRKAFLYETDERFGCSEGPPFQSHGPIESLHGLRVQVGICMDLNPYQFKAPFTAFEFANSAKHSGANLILCPMNWLTQQSPSLDTTADKETRLSRVGGVLEEMKQSPSPQMDTVNYWATRMMPFLEDTASGSPSSSGRVGFVACNRIGAEDDVIYTGSSTMLTFLGPGHQQKLEFHGALSQSEEGLLYSEVEVDQ